MKIYDIISESRLTEAPGGPVVGEFINAMLKGMAWAVGRGPRAKAAEQLAKVWAEDMIAAGKPTVKFSGGLGKNAAAKRAEEILTAAKMDPALAADELVVKDGFDSAKKIFLEAERKGLLKDIKTGAGIANKAVADFINWFAGKVKPLGYIYAAWEATDVFTDFYKAQLELKRQLDANIINQDTYAKDTLADQVVLIGQLGAAIVGGIGVAAISLSTVGAIKFAFIRRLKKTGPWTAPITAVLESATPAALVLFFKFITSEDGRKMFAEWLTSAGGVWMGFDGIWEYATNPKSAVEEMKNILLGGGGSNVPPAQQQPAQSGQRQQPAVVGTTPSGATLSGDWK